jgi:acetoin utilization deacetylase AcuC-like enzyme
VRPLARAGEGGVEPGGSRAHHGHVGPERRADGLVGHRPGYGNAIVAPLYFHHASSLRHETGAHPERADRIRAIEAVLARRGWLGWECRPAPAADLDRILAVHPRSHVDAVSQVCARGGAFDMDTPASPGSWDAALHAAGGACAMVEALLAGEAPAGFSALRPPGHHAERARAMGFCLFNNVAIGARHALDSLGADRVFVLDWDVHHGNGTNAIFHDSPEVLFASLHQWPFYPGTGALADAGEGEGEGYSINLPVPAGSGAATWLSLVEHLVLPAARAFGPDLVLVSAGFDAHRDDPIADCRLDTSSFAELAKHVRSLGEELGVPVGAVLEGGYDLVALSASLVSTMDALVEGGEARSLPPDALTEAAAEQVGRFWKLSV